jgi:hypothetical protein
VVPPDRHPGPAIAAQSLCDDMVSSEQEADIERMGGKRQGQGVGEYKPSGTKAAEPAILSKRRLYYSASVRRPLDRVVDRPRAKKKLVKRQQLFSGQAGRGDVMKESKIRQGIGKVGCLVLRYGGYLSG